ncbi:hypothetical protein D7Z54_15510 [Salibacterium salarium]|uniref:Uncharacterized protein n=1 Tax=Salibacterium salarium TaxID=284579 RepID=A0A3R9WSD5_9BACI|nr:hypothetical protein [Salibacterium salarium]RSL32558.1 hypothetical protein D7Z54_15510 [Salibacterium salarium]
MSRGNIYDLCCRYEGRTVRLSCRDGRTHVGIITRVDRKHVWLRPVGNRGAFGYGFYGGYGHGYGIPFALGAITGVALASAFFW